MYCCEKRWKSKNSTNKVQEQIYFHCNVLSIQAVLKQIFKTERKAIRETSSDHFSLDWRTFQEVGTEKLTSLFQFEHGRQRDTKCR